MTCNNLAALLHAQGHMAEAEQCYRRALAIKDHVLGPQHPDVAMTLNNLAVLYESAGKYAEAEPLYQRALTIFEASLGATHPKVVTCLQNYAQLLREMQRRAEALALEARAKEDVARQPWILREIHETLKSQGASSEP